MNTTRTATRTGALALALLIAGFASAQHNPQLHNPALDEQSRSSGHHHNPPPPPPPPPPPSTWGVIPLAASQWGAWYGDPASQWDNGTHAELSNAANGALQFTLPTVRSFQPGNLTQPAARYIETAATAAFPISKLLTVTMTSEQTAGTTFNVNYDGYNNCTSPVPAVDPAAHIIADSNGTCVPNGCPKYENSLIDNGTDRWWANGQGLRDFYDLLIGGTQVLTVIIEPQYWSDVNGQAGNASSAVAQQFGQAMGNANFGVTMGGGCFFGHGVSVANGAATVQIISATVE